MAEQSSDRVDNPTMLSRRQFAAGVAGAVAATALSTASAAEPAATSAGALSGKVAVITGAARGIGRAIAVDFAAAGADVIAIDIAAKPSPTTEYEPATPDDLAETGKLVQQHGRKYLSIVADQRDLPALRAAADTILQQFGRLDIVVADAAIQVFQPLLEMDDAHWHDVIDINLTGTANVIRAFAPVLVKQNRGGRIITLSSMQGRQGTKHAASYSASKWGIIGLTKSAAMELGEHKITVNAIVPGLIDTAMTRNPKRWSESIGEGKPNPPKNPTEQQVEEARVPKVPLKVPWLQPEQVSPVAVFLASDAAAMVTGACYDVTAGDSAHGMD